MPTRASLVFAAVGLITLGALETYWRGNSVWSTGAQQQLSADWSPERWLRNP